MSAHTIRCHLNEKGRYVRRPRRTPLLTRRNKKARLEFAKTYVTKQQSFWENILWTDETKFELFGKGHCTVYRKRNEAFKEKNTVPTAAVLNSSPRAPRSAYFVCYSYRFRCLFYSNVSALRSGHHRIFRHDSSSKRTYIIHSKCIEVCKTRIKIVYIYRGI